MNDRETKSSIWSGQVHSALVIAKKNMRIYYTKPPVLIFGVLFPVFFFLAFAIGRPVDVADMVPGMLAMALCFTASAVGPLVTPWERSFGTYERLITSPASLTAILGGDVLAGTAFGLVFSAVPLIVGYVGVGATVSSAAPMAFGILAGAVTFAALGVLLSAPATKAPSQIMMLSNLVRLPLIFVSGVFMPIAQMPVWGRMLAPISPLSYCVDLIRAGYGEDTYFPLWLNIAAVIGFAVVFFALALFFHTRGRRKAVE